MQAFKVQKAYNNETYHVSPILTFKMRPLASLRPCAAPHTNPKGLRLCKSSVL